MSVNENLEQARSVALRLRGEGCEAWLVGGCVRDLLLGREPKDCDVCTSAHPDRIRALFPGSLLVGAHFGVVIVKHGEVAVEVATFRSDGVYSDGRRPDRVVFETNVLKDLMRRDFTINALLMDPETSEIHDLVSGLADLEAGLIRAIGNARERFREDHLRMLRAVRFAARFGFAIERETWDAIREERESIGRISVERVRGELSRILTDGGAAAGMRMLRDLGLLALILPEAGPLDVLGRLRSPGFELALASVLLEAGENARPCVERLRLSYDAAERVVVFIANHSMFSTVGSMSMSRLKRFLRMKDFDRQLELYRAAVRGDERYEHVRNLRESMTEEMLWPRRLLSGDDLKALGVPAGPGFARLLTQIENAQMEETIDTRAEAEAMVRATILGESST